MGAILALIVSIIAVPQGIAYAQETVVADFGDSGGGGGGDGVIIDGLPMIKSQDALRNYALGITKFGSRSVYAQTLDWNWTENFTHTNAIGAYGEQVLNKLFSAEFVYRLANPEDRIQGYVHLYDGEFTESNDPSMLFYGYAEYTFVDLMVGKPRYDIWMQHIPLPLANVNSAEVLALGEDGKTANRQQLEINNKGQIMFPPWMAGAPNGILVVNSRGGLVTYDLANPVGEVPVGSRESSAWKVDGHYSYMAGGEKPIVVKIIEIWQRPSVFLDVRTENQIVTIDVMGIVQKDGETLFERPVSMEVTRQGGSTPQTLTLMPGPTEYKFPKGQFRIRFNWTDFGKPNMLYTGPTDGGGKG